MAADALRAHLAEFGMVADPGIANLVEPVDRTFTEPEGLPACARRSLEIPVRRLAEFGDAIGALDRERQARHAGSEAGRRRAVIPGVGAITATAIAATLSDPGQVRSGRPSATWPGSYRRA
ncbi:MAG: hypothetical protein R6V44_14955 [Paracoccaceae bacterium]